MIAELQHELTQMSADKAYEELAYLTFEDIMQLNRESRDTLIAVKAPLGSTIEMPDPEQLFQYFKQMGYSDDQIKCFQINISANSKSKSDGQQSSNGSNTNQEIQAFIIDDGGIENNEQVNLNQETGP